MLRWQHKLFRYRLVLYYISVNEHKVRLAEELRSAYLHMLMHECKKSRSSCIRTVYSFQENSELGQNEPYNYEIYYI